MKISLFILFLIYLPVSIFSDTLTLKDGKVFENVKLFTKGERFEVSFEDGTKKIVQTKFVKSLKLKAVKWRTQVLPKDEYELERLRMAAILLENTKWKPKEEEKPKLMILKYKKGKGIDTEKAESLSSIIRNKMIATNTFVISDRLSMEKELEKANCRNVTCSTEIASKLQVNKLMTGEISIHANKYHIQTEIVDISTRKVDFSDLTIIPIENDLEQEMDRLISGVSSGTLESWEFPVYNPESVSVVPYIWRSMLVPGWGQYHKETYSRSFVYPILMLAGGLAYSKERNIYQNNKNTYELYTNLSLLNTNSPANPLYYFITENQKTRANQTAIRVNQIANMILGVYIINLLDVIFTPIPMELKQISFQVQPIMDREQRAQGTHYALQYTFQF